MGEGGGGGGGRRRGTGLEVVALDGMSVTSAHLCSGKRALHSNHLLLGGVVVDGGGRFLSHI